jgi:ureidoacrylate peracid hydrolase
VNSFIEKVAPRWTAVLVVDMQNDFVSPGGVWERTGRDVSMARQALARIGTLVERARNVRVPIALIRSTYEGKVSEAFLHQAARHPSKRFIDVPVCVEASWGWQLAGPLESRDQDIMITKHRYSAFHDTGLDARLRGQGVRTLIVTGVGTAVCVESTVRHAFELDYYNVIPADCCAAYRREEHEQALQRIDAHYGEVTQSESLFAAWKACA